MDFARALTDVLVALRLRKARALLFYLVLDPGLGHRSEKFLDLLWQGVDGPRAALSFRQVVRHVRMELSRAPGIWIDTGGGAIALRLPAGAAAALPLDRGLAARLQAQPWDDAAAATLRDLLGLAESLSGLGASFDSWLAIARAALLSGAGRSLEARLAAGADPDGGRTAAAFALELDPANEIAVRHLMTLDWREGRASRAIERYNALYAHLDTEFDQEPEPATVDLLAAIKLDPGCAGSPGAPRAPPQIALAVMLTADPGLGRERQSLAQVLQMDLRLRLGRFREWRVIDPGGPVAPQVVIRLRPVALPEGMRLFVEVQQGADGRLLWSEAVDQPSRGWDQTARRLLIGIANALSLVVAERSPGDGAAAVYDRWLRSQALLDDWSPATEGQAIAMLADITREAPRFGPAHAELAGALNVRHVLLPGTLQTDALREAALHHAIEAVSIDPLDTRAHRVLAWCYCHKAEFELAEFHFDQALALNPANPLTMASCALGYAFADSLDKARRLADETRRLDAGVEPYHRIYLAAADYLCGDHAAAAAACAQGRGLMTTVGGWHSAALWHLGRRDEARRRLTEWTDEIRPQWRGAGPASTAAILEWFAAVFPLRNPAARAGLLAALEASAAVA